MKVKGSSRQYENKEKVAVGAIYVPTGEKITKGFNAEWGGYRFSDEEIEALLNGEEITIVDRNNREVTGTLEKGVYNKFPYWAFTAKERTKVAVGETYLPTGEVIVKGFNGEWGGYKFSETEIKRLLKGEEITIVTKKNKPVSGILSKKSYKGVDFWGFTLGIPNTFCGHNFTSEEKESLYNGDSLYIDDFWSERKAKNYAAYIEWDSDENDMIMSFDEFDEE